MIRLDSGVYHLAYTPLVKSDYKDHGKPWFEHLGENLELLGAV